MSSSGWWRRYSAVLLCFSGFLALNSPLSHAAGFTTNFQPTASNWSASQTLGYCGFNVCPSGHSVGNGDPTPFEESFIVVNNVKYIHVLVGDPTTGFASESYTLWGPGPYTTDTSIIPDLGGVFNPAGGGNETSVIGNVPLTATNVPAWNGAALPFLQNNMNMSNPFAQSHISGTGTTDPSTTVFRVVVIDPGGGMSMDVSKPYLDKKPIISQTVQDGTMSSVFVTDMRALSYSDKSTAAPVVNNLVINDPNIPGSGAGNFEMALAQTPDITSGRFTFDKPGNFGWNNANGWIANGSSFVQGSYSYIDSAGFNPVTFDYASVFDYAQNATACTQAPSVGVVRQQAGGPVAGAGVGQTTCPGHP
jgi:hypothetical protein